MLPLLAAESQRSPSRQVRGVRCAVDVVTFSAAPPVAIPDKRPEGQKPSGTSADRKISPSAS